MSSRAVASTRINIAVVAISCVIACDERFRCVRSFVPIEDGVVAHPVLREKSMSRVKKKEIEKKGETDFAEQGLSSGGEAARRT